MTDVFISYSHLDKAFASALRGWLLERGKSVFMDEQDIPPASRWADDLAAAIEAAESFVFVISPDAAASVECRRELDHAAALNKRLIPVHHRETPVAELPAALVTRNFVPPRGLFGADIDASMGLLISAIDTDLDWVREHTAWGAKALEWDAHDRDRSFLLSGTELAAAERFLAASAGREPAPTQLQNNYVIASRHASTRRQRRLLAGVSVALIVALALGVVALVQRSNAISNERSFNSEHYAAVAEGNLGSNPQASTRLSLSGLQVKATAQAEDALREALPQVQLLRTITMPDHGAVRTAAFSHSGARVVTTDGDAARVWNAATGRAGPIIREPTGAAITSASFSPDGSKIATSSEDGTARVWNAATGAPLAVAGRVGDAGLYHVAWSPPGTLLLTAGSDGDTRAYLASTGKQIAKLDDSTVYPYVRAPVYDAQFDAAGDEIVSGTEAGTAIVWFLTGNRQPKAILAVGAVTQASFNPSGTEVLTPDGDGTAKIWSVSSGQAITTLGTLGAPVIQTASFSPDGGEVVTGGHDGTAQVWDPQGRELLALSGHHGIVSDAAFSDGGGEIVTAGSDGTARIWDAEPREALTVVRDPGANSLLSVSFSPNGSLFATAGVDGTIRVWRTATGAQVSHYSRPSWVQNGATIVAFSPDGTKLLAAGADGVVAVLDPLTATTDGSPLQTGDGSVLGASWSPDGSEFATASDGGEVAVWNAASGARVRRFTPAAGQPVFDVAFSPDGRDLVTADGSGKAQIWNAATGKPVGRALTFTGSPGMLTAAYNRAGTRILTAGVDGVVRVWSVASRREIDEIGGTGFTTPSGDYLGSAAFNAAGTEVLAAADDGTAWIWSLATLRPLTVLGQRDDASVVSAVFDPRGDEVATVDEAGRAIVWSTQLTAALPSVERIASDRVPPLSAAQQQAYLAGLSGG